jgi:hypothetical protein
VSTLTADDEWQTTEDYFGTIRGRGLGKLMADHCPEDYLGTTRGRGLGKLMADHCPGTFTCTRGRGLGKMMADHCPRAGNGTSSDDGTFINAISLGTPYTRGHGLGKLMADHCPGAGNGTSMNGEGDEGHEGREEDGSITIGTIQPGTRTTSITIDSGAGVSVWPAHLKSHGQPVEGGIKTRLEAANGTPIRQYGRKKIPFEVVETKRNGAMEFVVTDVTKPLAAVSAIVEAGNKVIFSKAGSYIENVATGERVNLKCERGTYSMDVQIDAVADEAGFIGQA